jgi:hypothetical protein
VGNGGRSIRGRGFTNGYRHNGLERGVVSGFLPIEHLWATVHKICMD